MIDNHFREILPRFIRPLIFYLARIRINPSFITILGLLLAFCAAYFVATGHSIIALFLWILSRLCDGLDGILARHLNLNSPFGSYLDIVCDLAAYSSMVVGFSFFHPSLNIYWMVILCGYILCITSALSLGMQEQLLSVPQRDNRGLRLGAGLAEGGETLCAYIVFLLFPDFIDITVIIWTTIVFATVIFRTKLAYQILK